MPRLSFSNGLRPARPSRLLVMLTAVTASLAITWRMLMSLTRDGRQNNEKHLAVGGLASLPPRDSPTLQRRRLGNEIRRVREAAGLAIDQVASHLYCSNSKIFRIEAGQVSATVRDVRDILDFCGARKQERDSLLELANQARQRAWWHAYKGMPTIKTFVSYETAAASIWDYQAIVIPGLLQIPEYARLVIGNLLPNAEAQEIEHRVKFRMARQILLTGANPPEYRAVLDEAVLRRVVGDHGIVRQQLHHLVDVSSLPNVALQVLRFTSGSITSITGGFVILRFFRPDEPDIVHIEHTRGNLYFEGFEETQQHRHMFEHLRTLALTPEDSAAFLMELAQEQ
jgi:transcriptional regulator with XRE-family HTH domain